MTSHVLDNPVWASLTTAQSHCAAGGELARRYPADVAPFAAIRSIDAPSVEELAQIVAPGESVYLVGVAPAFDARWTLLSSGRIAQMVWTSGSIASEDDSTIAELTTVDANDMIALATLAFPGFFRPRTPEMGRYCGIRANGVLAAMAGERMRLTGFQEVSGVCTHPDFTGRGYAARLVASLVRSTLQRDAVPFLHVGEDNARARALYSRLGFVERRLLPLWLIRRNQLTNDQLLATGDL
jgi:ribosomal protein S18 acetylase RimI-like enzyme